VARRRLEASTTQSSFVMLGVLAMVEVTGDGGGITREEKAPSLHGFPGYKSVTVAGTKCTMVSGI